MVGVLLILGGLALFMYGIRLLSSGMEKLAGDQITKWLERVTGNRLKSAGFGAAHPGRNSRATPSARAANSLAACKNIDAARCARAASCVMSTERRPARPSCRPSGPRRPG